MKIFDRTTPMSFQQSEHSRSAYAERVIYEG